MQPQHHAIVEIALAAAGSYGLALAGGYAVQLHGMGNRPSGDVDLFTDWQRRADFPAAADAVITGLQERGYDVSVVMRGDTFARLLVQALGSPVGTEPDKVELAADWRANPPVELAIGPVLHADDAIANKMSALYGRALARDFLDVDAAIVSGRYKRDRLLELAANADSGFDVAFLAQALGALTQITDEAFEEYGTTSSEVAEMRRRFAEWREELLRTLPNS